MVELKSLALLQVFDFKSIKDPSKKRPFSIVETTTVRDFIRGLGPTYHGLYLYIEFGHVFLRIFLMQGTPLQAVQDANFCILFTCFWRRDIEQRQTAAIGNVDGKAKIVNIANNAVTSVLFDDVNITGQTVTLAVALFMRRHREARVDFGRSSSKWSEYLFQVRLLGMVTLSLCAQLFFAALV